MGWVFPEPILPQGADVSHGVHARHVEKPDCLTVLPLEPLVQGRKLASALVGDAALKRL